MTNRRRGMAVRPLSRGGVVPAQGRRAEQQGFYVPGLYEAHVPYRQSDKRPDPRMWLYCDDAEETARLDAARAEAEVEEAVYKAEALERGEPFVLPRWYVGGNHFP